METVQNVGQSERPKSVSTAVMLLVVSTLLMGLIRSVLEFSATMQEVSEVAAGTFMASPLYVISIQVVTLAFMLFLVYMIYNGKNWARITDLVLFIIGLPFGILPLINSLSANPISGVLGLLQIIMQAYALILLFTKDSSAWFNKKAPATSHQ